MNMSMIFQILLTALLPALWAAFGPIATTAITAFVNQVVGKYVPRPVQLILSSLVTAVLTGLTGELEGLDTITAVGLGAATGLGMQAAVHLNPATMLATAPESVQKG